MTNDVQEKTLTPLQKRAVEWCTYNQEWLQWFMDDTFDRMPRTLAGGVRILAQKTLGMKQHEFWKLVPIVITGMEPQQFDEFCQFFREFLNE